MRIFYLLLLVVVISACSQRAPSTVHDKQQVVAEIQATMQAYYDDIRKEGLLGEFKYLDSSADFFWVPPGYHSHISYDSVAAILKLNAHAYKMIDNSWDHLHIVPLTDSLAIYTGHLRSTITDTSGNTSVIALLETGTVVKRKSGWKLLCGQTSAVAN